MSNIAEIFSPLIPAIIRGDFILGFRSVISNVNIFENSTKTLVQMSQFWAGTNYFLWLIGEAVFHFIPVHIVMDIVDINGEGFESFVKAGDKVKKGDLIVCVDLDYIKNNGKSLVFSYYIYRWY